MTRNARDRNILYKLRCAYRKRLFSFRASAELRRGTRAPFADRSLRGGGRARKFHFSRRANCLRKWQSQNPIGNASTVDAEALQRAPLEVSNNCLCCECDESGADETSAGGGAFAASGNYKPTSGPMSSTSLEFPGDSILRRNILIFNSKSPVRVFIPVESSLWSYSTCG